ncbi:MAG: DUF4202 domain-containing protein [Casimicrobiaceae bacterium]
MANESGARDRFDDAIARFDAANSEDPNEEIIDGRARPKELVYAERMTAMLARFSPDASEVLRLAARCQHIQRWKIPRSDYAMDRIGYLQWRKRLNKFHAQVAGDMLRDAGYDEATIARVGALLKKEALKSDPDAQALEDVVGLVFLESYLAGFVAAHAQYDPEKFADILGKTAKKMSARGLAAAVALIAVPTHLAPVVKNAMASGAA